MLVRISHINVELENISPSVIELMKPFAAEGTPDFSVSIQPGDIESEREWYADMLEKKGIKNVIVPELHLEMSVLRRKVRSRTPLFGALGIHGSAIAVDGMAYVFTANSGTGKSTHTRLWREMLGEHAVMVNDDKPMLRVDDGITTVYGSPWTGKHKIGSNTQAPVRAICFLERSMDNWIREIPRHEAFPDLFHAIFRPADPVALARTMELLEKMDVRYYRLGCNMEPEAARVAYEGMR